MGKFQADIWIMDDGYHPNFPLRPKLLRKERDWKVEEDEEAVEEKKKMVVEGMDTVHWTGR